MDEKATSAPKSANPQKNRRCSFRHLPKRKLRISCRNAMDLGPNIAVALLDLSESGARLEVSQDVKVGQEVTITLDSVVNMKSAKRLGNVLRCQPLESGHYALGVAFTKRLAYAEVSGLAGV